MASLRNEKMLREVMAFFPGRVRAIIDDEEGIHLVLSDLQDIPPSQPIWIEIQGGGVRQAAVTFSGQILQIAGDRVKVFADSRGHLTLSGNRISWSSESPKGGTSGFHITAQVLPIVL